MSGFACIRVRVNHQGDKNRGQSEMDERVNKYTSMTGERHKQSGIASLTLLHTHTHKHKFNSAALTGPLPNTHT